MNSQLIYVSVRSPQTTESDIRDILNIAVKKNPSLDITGVLLYTNSRFIQFLEGPYDNIRNLYDSIKKDKRHSNVILLSLKKNHAATRMFPSWAMGGKAIDDKTIKFDSKLSDKENKAFMKVLDGSSDSHTEIVNILSKVFK